MIKIDGKKSGGQALRTSTALSVLTGQPFKMINIRSSRPNPGLKVQHLEAVRSLKTLSKAKVKGLKLKSKKLEFIPRKKPHEKPLLKMLNVKIPTAGSIGLLLQALLLATCQTDEINITVDGGATWNLWAPSVVYLKHVLFPLLWEESKIRVLRDGFYPRGGSYVRVKTKKLPQTKIDITEPGEIQNINVFSFCSEKLRRQNVHVRQAVRARKLILKQFNIEPYVQNLYSHTLSPGSGLLIYIKTANSVIGADAIGELRKSSEAVAEEAFYNLMEEFNGGAVDSHAADMLIPYMGLAGSGRIKTSRITDHIKSNIDIVEQFIPVKFKIDENIISL